MTAPVPDEPDLTGLHEIFSRAAAGVDRGDSDTRPGLRLLGAQGLRPPDHDESVVMPLDAPVQRRKRG